MCHQHVSLKSILSTTKQADSNAPVRMAEGVGKYVKSVWSSTQGSMGPEVFLNYTDVSQKFGVIHE